MGGIKLLWKKYSTVVIVPTFLISLVIADYSHTRRWKASQALQNQQAQ